MPSGSGTSKGCTTSEASAPVVEPNRSVESDVCQANGFNASNAMACSSWSDVQRLRGSGSKALRNAASVLGGKPARFALPEAARSNTAIIGFVPNTGEPVAANASTDAVDHQSVASLESAPSMISGAMKPGVPITRPVRVTWLSFSPMAMPKSTSTGPVAEIITLVGLISRWIMPAACTAPTASISLRARRSRSLPTYGPFAATSSLRFLPSISSVTMNATASSSSMSTMPHTPGLWIFCKARASRRKRSRAGTFSLRFGSRGSRTPPSSDRESRRIFIA